MSEFTIIENQQGRTPLDKRYDYPVLTMSSSYGILSALLMSKLKITKGDSVTVAYRGDELYFAIIPTTSKVKGFSVRFNQATKTYIFNTKKFVAKAKAAVYKLIDEPIFEKGIDWYPIEAVTV